MKTELLRFTTQLVVDESADVCDTVSCCCPKAKSDEPEPAGLWSRPETNSDETDSGSCVCCRSDEAESGSCVCPEDKSDEPENR